VCGNGACDSDEDCNSCPGDCGSCSECGNGVVEEGEECEIFNIRPCTISDENGFPVSGFEHCIPDCSGWFSCSTSKQKRIINPRNEGDNFGPIAKIEGGRSSKDTLDDIKDKINSFRDSIGNKLAVENRVGETNVRVQFTPILDGYMPVNSVSSSLVNDMRGYGGVLSVRWGF